MRRLALAVLLTAVAVAIVPGSLAQERPPARPAVKPVVGHDVFEARFVLITPTVAADPRLRHVLGDATSDPDGRFLTVGDVDPEKLVLNLHGLGDLAVLDRANLVAEEKKPAYYRQTCRIPVPQVETRNDQTFVRQKYESIGTQVSITTTGIQVQAELEASFVLDHTSDGVFPLLATATWKESFALAPGRTAVFKSLYHVPGLVRGAKAETEAPPQDRRKILLVLLTRSPLQ
jgi:hypothetical protein